MLTPSLTTTETKSNSEGGPRIPFITRRKVPAVQPMFSEQLRRWAVEATSREHRPISYATLQKYLSYLKWALPAIGDTRLDQINESLLEDVFVYLKKQTTQRGGPPAPLTLEGILKTILLVKGSYRDEAGALVYLKRERRVDRGNVGLW